jgi:hypothetical protein
LAVHKDALVFLLLMIYSVKTGTIAGVLIQGLAARTKLQIAARFA